MEKLLEKKYFIHSSIATKLAPVAAVFPYWLARVIFLLLLSVQVLSPSNMHSRFSALLWLEELHAEKEMKELAIHCAFLKKGGGHLHLEIPGLSEGRPSLNLGDKTYLFCINICWAIAKFHVVRFLQKPIWHILSVGDRVLLKKPHSDGVVMEYVSYVTEVHRCLRVQSKFSSSASRSPDFSKRDRIWFFLLTHRSAVRKWAWE